MTILTATAWPTNAELIEDVARLGYLSGQILDCTYGYGTFWKNWRPAEDRFVACDIDEAKSPLGVSINFCKLPFNSERFDSVVFDPPYKMNGTSRPEDRAADERYGVHIPARWQDRMQLICDGLIECMRVSRRYVLAKCMDQVVSGRKVWQTATLYQTAWNYHYRLVDRFDMLVTPRPQPEGRRQVHTQAIYSTLLVFERIS